MEVNNLAKGLLCFGGSFNPLHNGHLRCVEEVASRLGFIRAVLVPAAKPPHKKRHDDLASATDRLTMCRIAVEGSRLLDVSDIEIKRDGPSYTIDSVRAFRAMGWPQVHWLIGADMLAILPKWHRAEELIAEATILILERPGSPIEWEALPERYRHLRANVVPAPLIDISATEIRRRVRAGESIEGMVPPKVAAYIEERGLYR